MRIDPVEKVEIDGEVVDIDKEAVLHTLAFNELGLKTIMSCQGHDYTWPRFTIWFSKDVTDKQVKDVHKSIYAHWVKEWKEKGPIQGLFGNWVKELMIKEKNGEIIEGERWMYYTVGRNASVAIRNAKHDYKYIKLALDELKVKEIHDD